MTCAFVAFGTFVAFRTFGTPGAFGTFGTFGTPGALCYVCAVRIEVNPCCAGVSLGHAAFTAAVCLLAL